MAKSDPTVTLRVRTVTRPHFRVLEHLFTRQPQVVEVSPERAERLRATKWLEVEDVEPEPKKGGKGKKADEGAAE